MIVDASLGGGDKLRKKSLSDTERGILEYILTSVFKVIHETCGETASFKLQLQSVLGDPRLIRTQMKQDEEVVELKYNIVWKDESYLLKVILPDVAVTSLFMGQKAISELGADGRKLLKRQVLRYGFIKVPIQAAVGSVEVSSSDIGRLEEGDVILFDESSVSLDKGSIVGKAKIIAGGEDFGCIGALEFEGKRLRCRIE